MLRKKNTTVKWMYDITNGFRKSIILLSGLVSLVGLSNIAIAVLSKQLVDTATKGEKNTLYGLLIVYVVFIISEIVIGSINSYVNITIWHNLATKIRLSLYQRLINSNWLEFNKLHSGDYASRFMQDAATLTNGIVDQIPWILASVVKFIAAFCVMAYYQPMIAIFTVVFAPVAFLITRIYSKKIKENYKQLQKMDSEILERLQEFFHNIQVIKVFDLEELSGGILAEVYKRKKSLAVKNAMLGNMMNVIKSIGAWGGYLLAFSVGIFGISSGKMSFGVLVAFLELFGRIQGPMMGIAASIPKMTVCYAAAERLIELENLKKDEKTNQMHSPSSVSIVFDNVGYSYPTRESLLKNLNFRAQAGEVVLVMGKSGAGKTTMVRLLLSLITPDSGRIIFVDENNNEYTANAENRKWISYVPQGNSLFSGTIASNIRYGNLSATDEEIVAALISSEAWDFVSDLKEGIHTVIGERGVGLSEGQAQRVAIARALVHKSPAVVLDEATSGLDAETEKKVMENIRRDYKNKTFIVITHREAVKDYSDRVYRLQDGILVQEQRRM